MGRKRNQGKARRAAKAAKAAEEANESENNSPTANSSEEADERDNNQAMTGRQEQSLLSAQMRQLQVREEECYHGFRPFTSPDDFRLQFVSEFHCSFHEANESGECSLSNGLIAAVKATFAEFADVWDASDSAKLEMVISYLLVFGTRDLLDDRLGRARDFATFARFFEQLIATDMKQTQALYNWPKIEQTYFSDDHTLVKFYRSRIPCSCLDEKYKEVKDIPKMSMCYNPQCNIPDNKVERSKTKYCSRCRCVTYCSRECQVADWSRHKFLCDNNVAVIAKFEAKMAEKQASPLLR